MEQALDGPADDRRDAFPRMHAGEDGVHYITDRAFFDRATDLACATPSLVTIMCLASARRGRGHAGPGPSR